jgi:hypothetical protein
MDKDNKQYAPVEQILDWGPWEFISHAAFAILFIVIIYFFFVRPNEHSLTNWLLLLIGVGVAVQIHQNINLKRRLGQ